MRKYIVISALLVCTLYSCSKFKTNEVYDNYISLNTEEHLDVFSFEMKVGRTRIDTLYFAVKHNTDTIIFKTFRTWIPDDTNSVLEMLSGESNIFGPNTSPVLALNSIETWKSCLYLNRPNPLQFKLSFHDDADMRDSHGAKDVYLNITEETHVFLFVGSYYKLEELAEPFGQFVKLTNELISTIADTDYNTPGLQPFVGKSFVYMK